jgi:hypothetical protein
MLTAPIPALAPVIRTVFPSRREALKTDMVCKSASQATDT